jgi:hypothetical protein
MYRRSSVSTRTIASVCLFIGVGLFAYRAHTQSKMTINIVDGKHLYEFDYSIAKTP